MWDAGSVAGFLGCCPQSGRSAFLPIPAIPLSPTRGHFNMGRGWPIADNGDRCHNGIMPIKAVLRSVALLFVSGCTSSAATVQDDQSTGLTLTGQPSNLQIFLDTTETVPHRWVVERQWSNDGGLASIRLRWPTRPSPSDVGSIVAIAQAARSNKLQITNTSMVEITP